MTVHKGESKTIQLLGGQGHCVYRHEAIGTALGKTDVRGDTDSSVTCKKDWAGVCQCTKD